VDGGDQLRRRAQQVDRRAQWGGDAVPPGFVRLSCGIEDTEDLVADLSAGLAALG